MFHYLHVEFLPAYSLAKNKRLTAHLKIDGEGNGHIFADHVYACLHNSCQAEHNLFFIFTLTFAVFILPDGYSRVSSTTERVLLDFNLSTAAYTWRLMHHTELKLYEK